MEYAMTAMPHGTAPPAVPPPGAIPANATLSLLGSMVRTDGAHRDPAPVRAPGVLAVYSGQGGVGTTTTGHVTAEGPAGGSRSVSAMLS